MSTKKLLKAFGLLLVVGLLFAVAPIEQAQAQTPDTGWYTGDGPYVIGTADQLAGLAQLVNGGNNFAGKAISLSNNIDLAAYTNWTPIGGTLAFNGVFDGGGYTISNLTINRPDEDAVGLFGYVSGTIQNFTLSSANITGRNMVGGASGRLFSAGKVFDVTVTGIQINAKHWAGGIAGHVFGQLNNVQAKNVTVTLTFDTVANDNGDKGGGLVGYMDETTLSNCSATNVTISGTRDVGGLVGAAGGSTITNCTSTGASVTSTNIDGNTLTPYTGGAVGRASGALTITNVNVTNATLTSTPAGYTGLVVGGGTGTLTLNNIKLVHGTTETFYATIQAAVTAAVDGDTIVAYPGTYVVNTTILIDKAITLQGQPGAKIQVSGTGDRIDIAAAATLTGFEIEKTDKLGEQNIIRIRSSNVTISGNHIHGQYVFGDGQVDRAMVINAGAFSGISITGNEIHNLRQPAYISGTHTGTISANNVYTTRGWVLEGGNLTFTGNTWGDGLHPNAVDIAIIPNMPATYYTDIAAMSAANNNAVIEDQRTTPRVLSVVFVDDSAAPGGDGTQLKPYQTIQEGITRVVAGGTVHVAAGTYTENVTVNKDITLDGATDPFGSTPAVVQGLITISAQGATVQDLKVTPGSVVGQVAAVSVYASNTTVSGNLIDGMVGDNTATIKGIHVYGGSTTALESITISGNTIKNISNPGTLVKGTDGIQIQGNLIGVNVTNNIIQNISSQGWAFGIEVTPSGANPTLPPQDVVITGNTISNISAVTYPGIALSVDAYNAANPANASEVTVNLNRFNLLPVVNKDGVHSLNAENNWWGTAIGPQPSMMFGTMDASPWCTNLECTLFAEASEVTITAVSPVVCGNTLTSTIDINVAGVPATSPMQGYQFRLHFDNTKTSIVTPGLDVVNGGFVLNGGFLVTTWIDGSGNVSATPTNILEVAYTQFLPSTSTGDGTLASIKLTHLGVPGDIALSITDVVLSTADGYVIPSEASATPVTLTLSPAVLNITKVPNVGYCDLASAVAGAAASGDVLQLQANITIPTTVSVDKALTLDLNGKVASYTPVNGENYVLQVTTGGALTVKDSLTGGTIRAIGGSGRGINVNGGSLLVNSGSIQGEYASVNVQANSSMTLAGGNIGGVNGTTKYSGIGVTGSGATLTVTGGTIQSYDFGIYGNGSAGNGGTTINIQGGSINSDDLGIYHPQAGTLNISGGTITGAQGVEMRSGTLNVTGGTIHATGAYVAVPDLVGGSSTTTGDAIFVGTSDDSYAGHVVVNISGTTAVITSDHGFALREAVKAGVTTNTDLINVTGGSFYGGLGTGNAGAVVKFDTVASTILKLTGGLYNTDPADPIVYVYVPYGTIPEGSMFRIVGISLNVHDFYYNNSGTLRGVSTDFTVTNFLISEASSVTVNLYSSVEGAYVLQQTNVLKAPADWDVDLLTSSFDYFGTYVSNSWANTHAAGFDPTLAPTRVEVIIVLPGGTLTGFNDLPDGDRTTILPGVSGLVTLQGILAPRAGVGITLTPVSGVTRTTSSIAALDINYGFTGVETLTYTFTTSQPRYLNVTTASGKTFLVDRDLTLNPLRLYGGDVDQTNEIDVNDASLVGQAWGSTADPNANINYDGIVNIQDLALVGGNYGLISATAYSWVPVPLPLP